MATDSATSTRSVVLDEDGDTIITLPYYTTKSTSSTTGEKGKQAPSAWQNNPKEPAPADEAVELDELELKVSKKHLIASCRRARAVLSGGMLESARNDIDGLHHWRFEPIFDPDAFEIVMSIIHGHTKTIPQEVTLSTLADIAAVVDDLDCEEAVWFCAKSWIPPLKTTLPDMISDDLERWILVSSVFDEPDIFFQCTKTAILHSAESFPTAGLPIRPSITDGIAKRRQEILDEVFEKVQQRNEALCKGLTCCTFECNAALLGSLVQGMSSLEDSPELSIGLAIVSILTIQSPTVYSPQMPSYYNLDHSKVWHIREGTVSSSGSISKKLTAPKDAWYSEHLFEEPDQVKDVPTILERHKCNLKKYLASPLKRIADKVTGLPLSDFVST